MAVKRIGSPLSSGPSRILISSTTTSATTALITLSSIPQIYKDLHLVIDGPRTTVVGNAANPQIQFNSNTTAVYGTVRWYQVAGAGSFAGSATTSAGSMTFTGAAAYNTGINNTYLDMMIYSYTSSLAKRTFTHYSTSNATTHIDTALQFGIFNSASAISSIDFITSAGFPFRSGMVINLYGIVG
jgi:hypothetical protein